MAYAINPATLRLAAWVSVLGVAAAVALDAAGWAPRPLLVVAVMVIGVATSSVRTNRLPQAQPSMAQHHRVTRQHLRLS